MEQEKSLQNRIYRPSLPDSSPLRQGEILSGIIQVKLNLKTYGTEDVEIDLLVHPYAIIVSQDCDLDWDFRARHGESQEHKRIPSILFCEISTARNLSSVILNIENVKDIKKSRIWSRVKENKDERYHFLQQVKQEEDCLSEGLPELGVDFKRYFTIPADEVYLRIEKSESKRRCCLTSPYTEHFSSRFFYFQSRVALPEDHFSEPSS